MAAAAVTHMPGNPVTIGLTSQEMKDMERFVKFLCQKMVQVIIQSRLGEKMCTPCKAQPSNSDWFNLGIEDIPEVLAETKKALNGQIPRYTNQGRCTDMLCVEISLKTVEGDSLVLENWTLSVNESTDTSSRVTYTVYSRMSLLLKSIIAVSRVTPAYKLSGRQGADSFVLCYRIFWGTPFNLGESAYHCTIGQVDTPIGAYSVNLTYQTQLTISPKDGTMLVKSNHFTPEFSPRLCRAERPKQGESSSSDQATTSDESQDACRIFVNSPPNNKVNLPPSDYQQQQRFSFDDGPKFGAFADASSRRVNSTAEFTLPELPQPSFMRMRVRDSKKETTVSADTAMKSSQEDTNDVHRSRSSLGPNISEEYVMVESLKTPFAEGDSSHDVGAFFRECQSAPTSLGSFRGMAALEIGSQLEQFEKDMKDYDDLLKALCIDDAATKLL